MSFLDPFTEGLEEGASLTRSQIGSIIRAGLDEGASGASILRGLQGQGIGVREGSFYRMVGEVRNAIAMAGDIAAIPVDQTLTEADYATWTGGAADTYLHRVTLVVRESEEGVLTEYTKYWDVLSEVPLSPAEAEQIASDQFNEHAGGENYPTQQLFGSFLRGAYHQVRA